MHPFLSLGFDGDLGDSCDDWKDCGCCDRRRVAGVRGRFSTRPWSVLRMRAFDVETRREDRLDLFFFMGVIGGVTSLSTSGCSPPSEGAVSEPSGS